MIEVTDMYLVAVMISLGADYIGVDRKDKRNQKFAFKEPLNVKKIFTYKQDVLTTVDDPTFDDIKHAFDTCTLMYPPNYVEALRRVKGIIHT